MARKVVGQPKVLKEVNSNIIERIIVENGPITKPQIAKATGLSLPTVNKIVAQLEQDATIKACGVRSEGVGRKAILYDADGQSGNLLALYISGNRCTCCVVDMADEVVSRFVAELDLSSQDSPLESLCGFIDRMLASCTAQPKAIGIGVPGVVDGSGILSAIPGIPQWEGSSLAEQIQTKYQLQTCMENNAKLTALGYYDNHLRGQYEDVVYLHLGRGISAGIILGSRLFKGYSSFAGELGYMLIRERNGQRENSYQEIGNLELYFSDLLNRLAGEEDIETISRLKQEIVECLAQVITNLISVLNPQVVVFRGGVVNNELMEAIRERVENDIPARSVPDFKIDSGELSGIYGITSVCRSMISPSYNIMKG